MGFDTSFERSHAPNTKPESTTEPHDRIWIDWNEREFHLKPLAGYTEYVRADIAPPASTAPVVDNVGLNLLRQLIGGKNSLRTLGVFPCNQAEHEDVDCKCFWEQCEAWARQDAGVAPVNQLVCAKCGKTREGVSAESFLCRYCFSTESIVAAATAAPVEQSGPKWDQSGLKEACQRALKLGRTHQEIDIQLFLDMLLEIERLEGVR